ncbi:MAG: ATP-grasp domain-containing protein [Bacteroidales bacterium]|nr:ATP-grasp domain-containing protein [Bacteroidales bacterium]
MQIIRNILVANRGEIARRVIRTARKMGILTFAIYTDEEKDALFVKEADQSFSLGTGSLSETYLNISRIINIAKENHCDAIHPGYGFLSENALFAKACHDAGIIFIGPKPEAIQLMGNKNEARSYVRQLGVPLPLSITGNSAEEILEQSSLLKFPLMIKAVAGGGGKGMRIIHTREELPAALEAAGREAGSYFGNADLYVEQYIEDARHIEVQILGDSSGNIVHLFERECSVQRRHQKIIEEAPSPTLTPEIRKKLLDTAVNIAKSMHYTSAGTIEFLFDRELNFYFLEMNTRIQVEHPVTEAITGIDIVLEQIRVAMGLPLSVRQDNIFMNGHAMEVRIYAEDPFSGFLPSAGEMILNHLPDSPGVRLDSAFTGAARVSSSFDPMIAKITVHSGNRKDAIVKMRKYLGECAIHGIKTNLEYLYWIFEEEDFSSNQISTRYCENKAELLKNLNLSFRKK